ncbi:MAG TPA: hypothetical protein VET24_11465 [Actinomycetota bacterium]|nr:hypothetical protein [Actinomycetota bacterium]
MAGPQPDTFRKRRQRRHSTEVTGRRIDQCDEAGHGVSLGPLDLLELLVDAGLSGCKVLDGDGLIGSEDRDHPTRPGP